MHQTPPNGKPEPTSNGPCRRTAEDRRYLMQLESKHQMLRDRVISVVKGYSTGLNVYGEGGVGKSYTVLEELRRLKADFIVFNSRMTGRGLFNQLEQFPSSIHVLEDMEPLLRDRGAQGVLRSALWAQRRAGSTGPFERPVTWTTNAGDRSFVFTGAIILIGNRPIDDMPELRAVKTRIVCMHLEVTANELRAQMRQVAGKGYRYDGKRLEPAACLEVCEHLIEQSLSLRRSLDMRLLVNSFHDRLQWDRGDAACNWKDLVAGRLRERPTAQNGEPVSRKRKKQKEQQIVADILQAAPEDKQEQVRLWVERTGKSQSAWYRRLKEVGGVVPTRGKVTKCKSENPELAAGCDGHSVPVMQGRRTTVDAGSRRDGGAGAPRATP